MGEKLPPLPCIIHSRMGAGGVGTGWMHVQLSPGDSGVFLPDALLEDLLTTACVCLETNVQAECLQRDHHRSVCPFHSAQEPMPCAWKIPLHVAPSPSFQLGTGTIMGCHQPQCLFSSQGTCLWVCEWETVPLPHLEKPQVSGAGDPHQCQHGALY